MIRKGNGKQQDNTCYLILIIPQKQRRPVIVIVIVIGIKFLIAASKNKMVSWSCGRVSTVQGECIGLSDAWLWERTVHNGNCRKLDANDGSQDGAVCPEVAEFWECTEREVRGKYGMYLRTPPMARGRVQASALLEEKSQLIVRCFRPIVLDAVPRPCRKWPWMLICWSFSSDLCSVCWSWPSVAWWQRTESVACSVSCWFEQEEHPGHFVRLDIQPRRSVANDNERTRPFTPDHDSSSNRWKIDFERSSVSSSFARCNHWEWSSWVGETKTDVGILVVSCCWGERSWSRVFWRDQSCCNDSTGCEKEIQTWPKPSARISRVTEDADKGACVQTSTWGCRPSQENATIVEELDNEQTLFLHQNAHKLKKRQRKDTSRNQRLLGPWKWLMRVRVRVYQRVRQQLFVKCRLNLNQTNPWRHWRSRMESWEWRMTQNKSATMGGGFWQTLEQPWTCGSKKVSEDSNKYSTM